MRLRIILPLTLLVFAIGCGALKTEDKVETAQPSANSKTERTYDQTFETELVKGDGLVQIRVHNELDKDCNDHYTGLFTFIDIIKDDTVIDTLNTGIFMNSVTDISFFDFDCDGRNDIAITGDAPKFLLCTATSDYDYYVFDAGNITENIEKQRGNDFSMDKLKSVLLGNNLSCDYSDYKKAYSQMARLFKLQAYGSDNADNSYFTPSYDLIDIDGEYPSELVAESGNRVLLCSYKDGRVNEVFDEFDGSMFCQNIEYSPGSGIIRCHGRKWPANTCYIFYKNCKDLNHLYRHEFTEPDDYTRSTILWDKEKEINYTEQITSDDEAKNIVDGYSNLEYEAIDGALVYGEFIKALEEDTSIENRNDITDVNPDFEVSKKHETTEIDYSLYDEIINGIKAWKYDEGSLSSFVYDMNLSPDMYGSNFENEGYLQEDIDGDGVDELLLGVTQKTTSEYDHHYWGNYGDSVSDLFTIQDGKLLQIVHGEYRNMYYLCEGGIIVEEGSGSCSDGHAMVYRYSKGELKLVEGSEWVMGTCTCYRNKKINKIADPDAIYAEEYYKKYPLKKINYTPF